MASRRVFPCRKLISSKLALPERRRKAGSHRDLARLVLYLLRYEDIDPVASLRTVDQTQSAFGNEAAHGLARGRV